MAWLNHDLCKLALYLLLSPFIIFLTIYLCKIIAEAYLHYCYAWRNINGEIIPGPPPNLPDGDRYSRLSYGYELSQKYKNKYGPIYRIWDGKNAELVLTQPEDVLAFYKNGGMHIKPRHLNIGEFFHRIMGDSIGLKNQDEWRSMKKLTNPFFNEKASMSFLPEIIRDTKIWLQNLPKEPNTKVINNVSEFTFPLIESIKYLPFFWVSKLLYGRLISTENINQLVTMGELHESIMEICFSQRLPRFWLYKWFPTTNNQRLIQFLKQWKNFNIRMMQLADETGIHPPAYHMYQDVLQGKWTMNEYLETLDEILFTNLDNASATFGWQLIALAEWPSCQNKLRTEVHEVLKYNYANIESEIFMNYLLRSDTYLHYMSLEIARLLPTSAYSLPEMLQNEHYVRGFTIPRGSLVVLDAFTLNTLSDVWGNDSMDFKPERFANMSSQMYRYALWRFGLGPRKCLGIHYAEKSLKALLALTVVFYKVSKPKEFSLKFQEKSFLRMPITSLVFKPIAT